jgi:hypothetical protein
MRTRRKATVRRLALPRRPLVACKTNGSVFFECFPYVCPEPVLVKLSFLYRNGSKLPVSCRFVESEVRASPSHPTDRMARGPHLCSPSASFRAASRRKGASLRNRGSRCSRYRGKVRRAARAGGPGTLSRAALAPETRGTPVHIIDTVLFSSSFPRGCAEPSPS